MVQSAFDAMTSAASQLGSLSSRIDLQTNFASSLSDSLESGVGKLVDADMEEESSKLSALQTQQQLAVQSLSIANSSSQNILSLFRS
jgi:flagellin